VGFCIQLTKLAGHNLNETQKSEVLLMPNSRFKPIARATAEL